MPLFTLAQYVAAGRNAPPPRLGLTSLLAYVARYGHQPYNVMVAMTRRELVDFGRAIEHIVEKENTPKES